MKHFLGYCADGSISSSESHQGGWPDCDCPDPDCPGLANPNCTDERCVNIRALRTKHTPDIVGWVAVACPCPSSALSCLCPSKAIANNRVVNGLLVPKLAAKIVIDGAIVQPEAVIDQPPGKVMALKLTAPGAPDGTEATCGTRGMVDICKERAFKLVFNDGATSEVSLVAPAQGMSAQFGFGSTYVMGYRFTLRGWSS